MNKEQLIKKYLDAKSSMSGYLSMNNPNFNQKHYLELASEVEQLQKSLQTNNITEQEIKNIQSQMEQTGDYMEK